MKFITIMNCSVCCNVRVIMYLSRKIRNRLQFLYVRLTHAIPSHMHIETSVYCKIIDLIVTLKFKLVYLSFYCHCVVTIQINGYYDDIIQLWIQFQSHREKKRKKNTRWMNWNVCEWPHGMEIQIQSKSTFFVHECVKSSFTSSFSSCNFMGFFYFCMRFVLFKKINLNSLFFFFVRVFE